MVSLCPRSVSVSEFEDFGVPETGAKRALSLSEVPSGSDDKESSESEMFSDIGMHSKLVTLSEHACWSAPDPDPD